jgi:serine/threonine-protein kinase
MTSDVRHPTIERTLALGCEAAGATLPAMQIATGGGSIIFLVRTDLGQDVVIKMIDFNRISAARLPIAKNSLRHEAAVLTAATSPLVPRLLSHDFEAGFLVRQFVPGRVVQDILQDSSSSLELRLDLCGRVLAAAKPLFSQFHDWPPGARVIRDFKPKNLVSRAGEGEIVLVDVGGVRAESAMLSNNPKLHRIGSGAWRYWAPEQLLADTSLLDRRVDYFALGSTLFAILFGSPPYLNRSSAPRLITEYRSRHQKLARHVRDAAGIPSALGEFIIDCTSPDPVQRPGAVIPVSSAFA